MWGRIENHIQFGILTAERELESYKQAQELGGVLYITKRFKLERLVDIGGVLLTCRRRARQELISYHRRPALFFFGSAVLIVGCRKGLHGPPLEITGFG